MRARAPRRRGPRASYRRGATLVWRRCRELRVLGVRTAAAAADAARVDGLRVLVSCVSVRPDDAGDAHSAH